MPSIHNQEAVYLIDVRMRQISERRSEIGEQIEKLSNEDQDLKRESEALWKSRQQL